jgi:NTP pyrophosphatase (non-canonical NTP hydrolase)
MGVDMSNRRTEKYKDMLRDAIRQDGLQFCLDALQEECAECIQAISHLRRKRVTVQKVIDEMADTQIMLDMVRVGLDDEIGFQDRIFLKSERIGESIEFKKSNGRCHQTTQIKPCPKVVNS